MKISTLTNLPLCLFQGVSERNREPFHDYLWKHAHFQATNMLFPLPPYHLNVEQSKGDEDGILWQFRKLSIECMYYLNYNKPELQLHDHPILGQELKYV